MNKTEKIIFRVTSEEKKQIEKLAEENRQTVSQYVLLKSLQQQNIELQKLIQELVDLVKNIDKK